MIAVPQNRLLAQGQIVPPYSFCVVSWLRGGFQNEQDRKTVKQPTRKELNGSIIRKGRNGRKEEHWKPTDFSQTCDYWHFRDIGCLFSIAFSKNFVGKWNIGIFMPNANFLTWFFPAEVMERAAVFVSHCRVMLCNVVGHSSNLEISGDRFMSILWIHRFL